MNIFFVAAMCSVAALCGLLFGYDTGIISGALLFLQHDFHLSASGSGLIVSVVPLGALLGAISSGRLTDLIGRRSMLLLDAAIFILGTTLSATAHGVEVLVVGRFIVGVGVGIASYISPLYISEIAPTKFRGMLITLHQVFMSFGFLSAYLVNYYFAKDGNWQWMFGTGAIPAVVLFVGALYLPESPRWLLSSGRREKAVKTLDRIYGAGSAAATEMLEVATLQRQEEPRNWRFLLSPQVRPILMIILGLIILQQIVGINAILYYAPNIFLLAGFGDAHSAILATVGLGIAGFIFTTLALPLVDTVGRRRLLLIGLVGMGLSLALLSGIFYVGHTAITKWLALVAIIFYLMNFACSMGPLVWVLVAELFPLSVRGIGCGVATAVHWTADMILAFSFLSLIAFFGASGTFFMFFIVNIVCFIFVYRFIPETKHVSLEKIEANLI
jgi:sugar porter (SP) family MFS transporter